MQVQVNGQMFDADAVANLMDGDLREELNSNGVWDQETPQQQEQAFVDAYCRLHREKFGEDFVVN
jgi:hypothetical protein